MFFHILIFTYGAAEEKAEVSGPNSSKHFQNSKSSSFFSWLEVWFVTVVPKYLELWYIFKLYVSYFSPDFSCILVPKHQHKLRFLYVYFWTNLLTSIN
jgi:hypothetical protein